MLMESLSAPMFMNAPEPEPEYRGEVDDDGPEGYLGIVSGVSVRRAEKGGTGALPPGARFDPMTGKPLGPLGREMSVREKRDAALQSLGMPGGGDAFSGYVRGQSLKKSPRPPSLDGSASQISANSSVSQWIGQPAGHGMPLRQKQGKKVKASKKEKGGGLFGFLSGTKKRTSVSGHVDSSFAIPVHYHPQESSFYFE